MIVVIIIMAICPTLSQRCCKPGKHSDEWNTCAQFQICCCTHRTVNHRLLLTAPTKHFFIRIFLKKHRFFIFLSICRLQCAPIFHPLSYTLYALQWYGKYISLVAMRTSLHLPLNTAVALRISTSTNLRTHRSVVSSLVHSYPARHSRSRHL